MWGKEKRERKTDNSKRCTGAGKEGGVVIVTAGGGRGCSPAYPVTG